MSNAPCGHDEAVCIIGNFWRCSVCTPKRAPTEPDPTLKEFDNDEETHSDETVPIWGVNWNIAGLAQYRCTDCGTVQAYDIDWVATGGKCSSCGKGYLRILP